MFAWVISFACEWFTMCTCDHTFAAWSSFSFVSGRALRNMLAESKPHERRRRRKWGADGHSTRSRHSGEMSTSMLRVVVSFRVEYGLFEHKQKDPETIRMWELLATHMSADNYYIVVLNARRAVPKNVAHMHHIRTHTTEHATARCGIVHTTVCSWFVVLGGFSGYRNISRF